MEGRRWSRAIPPTGTGRATLLGTPKAATLVFDAGFPLSPPQVVMECEGVGFPTGETIWGGGFNLAHSGALAVGGFFGGMADLGYVIPLELSVDGSTFTASFTRTATSGDATVTEVSTFTLTPK